MSSRRFALSREARELACFELACPSPFDFGVRLRKPAAAMRRGALALGFAGGGGGGRNATNYKLQKLKNCKSKNCKN